MYRAVGLSVPKTEGVDLSVQAMAGDHGMGK